MSDVSASLVSSDDKRTSRSQSGLPIASHTRRKPKADIDNGGIKSLTQWSPHVTMTMPSGFQVTMDRRGAGGKTKLKKKKNKERKAKKKKK